MKKKVLIILILLITVFEGCWVFRAGMRNIPDAIFSSPEQIKNKIKDPIKPGVRLSALWVGHSTVLLQMYDKVILIDPVFNDVIGGLILRKKEAGLDINSIPYLNMILISHAHMDHMSLSSLSELNDKFPSAKLIIPKGDEDYLPGYDMDLERMRTGNSEKRGYIGETKYFDSVKVTTVFAKHFGGRYGLDSYLWNTPGYTGYIIEYKGLCIFYAGDTAYDEFAYKKIGKLFKIDLALIPIGPCRDCNSVGQFTHVASLGGLIMLEDLQAEYMIPVHYGIMSFTSDPDLPAQVLKDILDGKEGTSGSNKWSAYADRVKILKEGEQIIFDK